MRVENEGVNEERGCREGGERKEVKNGKERRKVGKEERAGGGKDGRK